MIQYLNLVTKRVNSKFSLRNKKNKTQQGLASQISPKPCCFFKIKKDICLNKKTTHFNKRAGYEKQIVVTVSRQLVIEYGNNYEEKNLHRMM